MQQVQYFSYAGWENLTPEELANKLKITFFNQDVLKALSAWRDSEIPKIEKLEAELQMTQQLQQLINSTLGPIDQLIAAENENLAKHDLPRITSTSTSIVDLEKIKDITKRSAGHEEKIALRKSIVETADSLIKVFEAEAVKENAPSVIILTPTTEPSKVVFVGSYDINDSCITSDVRRLLDLECRDKQSGLFKGRVIYSLAEPMCLTTSEMRMVITPSGVIPCKLLNFWNRHRLCQTSPDELFLAIPADSAFQIQTNELRSADAFRLEIEVDKWLNVTGSLGDEMAKVKTSYNGRANRYSLSIPKPGFVSMSITR